jgi:succinoglycan biosynthesis protein ExoO
VSQTAPAPIDVSVVIAAYKAQAFLMGSVGSALAQEGVALEVIVVDDCSPDSLETATLAAAGGDTRVRFIRLAQNGGPSAARNAGFDAARGTFAGVLDADDAMAPGRLARLVALARKSDADIVADDLIETRITPAGRDERAFLGLADAPGSGEVTLGDYMVSGAPGSPYRQALGYLKPLFRLATMRRLGVRYDEALRNSEDHYLVAHALAQGARMMLEPVAGYSYLRHDASISYRITEAQAWAIVEAERAFQARFPEVMQALVPVDAAKRRLALVTKGARMNDVLLGIRDAKLAQVLRAVTAAPGELPSYLGALFAIAGAKLGLAKAAP